MPIPRDSVQVHLGGRARMCLSNALMSDMHDLNNAIAGGPSFPSSVDFDVQWEAGRPLQHLRDEENRFRFQFFDARATIQWSYSRNGRTYTSNPEGIMTRFAVIGFEQNGNFFH